MADKTFYVDSNCIECGICRNIAPDLFGTVDGSNASYFIKQPESADEQSACQEAMDSCPVSAIKEE